MRSAKVGALPGLRARLTGLRQNAFETPRIIAVRERITQNVPFYAPDLEKLLISNLSGGASGNVGPGATFQFTLPLHQEGNSP